MASSERRVVFYKRVLALICCCIICLGMIEPPKAHAIAVADDVAAVAALFVAATGCTWAVTKMDKSSFTNVVGKQLQKYCTEKNLGTVADFASDMIFGHATGKILLNKAAAEKLSAFTKWLLNKFNIKADSKPVSLVDGISSITDTSGHVYNLTTGNITAQTDHGSLQPKRWISKDFTSGTFFDLPASYDGAGNSYIITFSWLANSLGFYVANSIPYFIDLKDGVVQSGRNFVPSNYYDSLGNFVDSSFSSYKITFFKAADGIIYVAALMDNGILSISESSPIYYKASDINTSGSVAISAEGVKEIHYPATDAITQDKSLAIAVPGTAADTLDGELGAILDAILAGKLAVPTTEVIDGSAAGEPGEVTDVDDLNLPSIATIITQKFPFSIPWDVVRGIKLLAAPSEAPKWSVDFMKPIEHRVGSWKGDTTVTLDMADYPLIGQVCRWCFTVGFCILLAAGTKKLSWIGG